MLNLPTKPLGFRSHITPDHVYIVKSGHIYTTASLARKVTLSGYASIAMTARQAPFAIQLGRQIKTYRVAAIKTPIKRAVYADDVRLVSFHLNSLHPMFKAIQAIEHPGLMELPRSAFTSLDEDLDAAYQGCLSIAGANKLFERVVESARIFLPEPKPSDARIAVVLSALQSGERTTLTELAASVDLSTGRMRHLFAETVGISLRSYLLWQKMHRVPILLAKGMSLTEVAHECGFADSAHMATAFQNIHGAPPSYFFSSNHVRFISTIQGTSSSGAAKAIREGSETVAVRIEHAGRTVVEGAPSA